MDIMRVTLENVCVLKEHNVWESAFVATSYKHLCLFKTSSTVTQIHLSRNMHGIPVLVVCHVIILLSPLFQDLPNLRKGHCSGIRSS